MYFDRSCKCEYLGSRKAYFGCWYLISVLNFEMKSNRYLLQRTDTGRSKGTREDLVIPYDWRAFNSVSSLTDNESRIKARRERDQRGHVNYRGYYLEFSIHNGEKRLTGIDSSYQGIQIEMRIDGWI